MLKVARYLHGKFWLVMAWLTIALAIVLSGVRLWLPMVDLAPYKAEIERIVEAEAGMPLTIGRMQAELNGFRLSLKFSHFALYEKDKTQPLVQAREVRVDVELLETLMSGELKLGGGLVVGTHLMIEHHADGSLSLQGMVPQAGGDSGALAKVLLGQSHLRLYDSEILLKGPHPGAPPLELSEVAVDLINDDQYHSLSVKAKVGAKGEETLRFIAHLEQGEEEDPLAVEGRFYLAVENLRMGQRLTEWMPEGYRIDRGSLDLKVWGDLSRGALQRLHGTAEMADFQITGPAIETPFQLERLVSELDWRRDGPGWRVDFDRLVLVRAGQLWPPGRLSLAWQSDEERGDLLRLGADYLSLKELNDLLAIIELPNQELGDALRGLSADGHLTKFGFALLLPPQGEVSWRITGAVARFSNSPWQSVPGLSGLQLSFDGNESGGWLHIDSTDFSVEFPNLFRQPISAKRVDGDFQWRFDPQAGLHLHSDYMEMHNQHVETLSRIRLNVPLSGRDIFIDMQTDFWNGDASSKSAYLPVGIMPGPLVEWLDRAVVSGHVNAGSFLLYGPLKEFPFRQQQGRFEVWFGVEDMILDYQPGWPRIEQGVAEALFVNNSLEVKLSEGLLLGNRIRQAVAQIRELKGASPVEIQGEVAGDFKEMLGFLGDTPLNEQFAPFVEAVEVGGQASTRVNLAIPLKQRDSLKIEGQVTLQDANMRVKHAELDVESINGVVSFDQAQLRSGDLQAVVLGHPIKVDITPKLTKAGRWTRIATHLDISAKELRRQFKDIWLPPATGQASGKLRIDIAHQESRVPVKLRVLSSLRGMGLDLPKPLGKRAANRRDMDLTVNFLADGGSEVRLRYNKQVHALVRVPADARKAAVTAIGFAQKPVLPASGQGICIAGSLDEVNLDHWLDWLSRQGEDGSEDDSPVEIDLRLQTLSIAGIKAVKPHFTLRNYADGYRVSLEGENIQGMIQVPGNLEQLPLLGRLDFIKFNLDELTGVVSGDSEQKDVVIEVDPHDLPSLDLTVDELYVNERNLGTLRLAWQKEKDGITINQLGLAGDLLDLSGQGYWRKTKKGHLTSINIKARTNSLGVMQDELGMASGIKDAPADLKAELYWPSSLIEMGPEQLYGSIWLKVGKGRVKDVEPGVGRLIGLFSLNALGKRLALDFRDFFSEGFSFDTIEGNFIVHDGVATTHDLIVQSPSAKIDFSGDTGLVERSYQQQVVVTPHLSATLPLVGALAVNPTVGVALALTQKLLGKQFDKIVQRTYEVTGSWDDPVFTLIAKQPLTEETLQSDMGIDLPGRP
jgi:uncharacterized protein (TIGR02099 family)